MQDRHSLTFGSFRMDLVDERLWRGQEALRLTNKAFAVLRYLVAHAEQLVTKEALLEAVWPGTFVGDAVLTVCIREVRQALGDSARTPQFIETIRGREYRFIVPVTVVERSSARPAAEAPLLSAVGRSQWTTRGAAPLVGREAELAQLHQWLATALRGERQMGFITGEAGIGKSALADVFVEQLTTDANLWIVHGQCIEQYGAGEAYLPVLEALGRLCRAPGGTHLIELLRHQAPSWLLQMPALLPTNEFEELQRRGGGATRDRIGCCGSWRKR